LHALLPAVLLNPFLHWGIFDQIVDIISPLARLRESPMQIYTTPSAYGVHPSTGGEFALRAVVELFARRDR
jgi:hypothetical protein